MTKQYYVYMLTNKNKNVLYTGVTNDVVARIFQHKNKLQKGFTKKYNVDQLVYCEMFDNIGYAIEREKQIKSWNREKKNNLINKLNPTWKDLYLELLL